MAKELTNTLNDLDSFILFGCDRLNAEQVHQFRVKLRENNISVKMIRNKLANIAFEQAFKIDVKNMLKGSVGIVYGGESPVNLAKTMTEWTKRNKANASIKGGYLSGQVLKAKDIEELAKVPSKEILLSQLAGAFVGSMQEVATLLSAAMQDISNAIGSLAEKTEEAEKVAS